MILSEEILPQAEALQDGARGRRDGFADALPRVSLHVDDDGVLHPT